MTPLAASILGAILCGIVMVVGGIVLLYKGSIKLEVASKDPALTVDLFKHQFSLSTRIPALGLFVIGLLFVGISMWVAMKTDVQRIPIVGEFEGVDQPPIIFAHTQWKLNASRHQVNDVLRPSLDVLWISIKAPGFRPEDLPYPVHGPIDLGKVRLERTVPKIEFKADNVEQTEFQAPKFDPDAGGFLNQ